MPRKKASGNIQRARQLRQDMSLPEILLWKCLRRAPGGVSFRRQHSFDEHLTVDFHCAKAKVCIEVDGMADNMGDNAERDRKRDEFLSGLGLEVVRIPAVDVLKSPEDIAEALVRYCQR